MEYNTFGYISEPGSLGVGGLGGHRNHGSRRAEGRIRSPDAKLSGLVELGGVLRSWYSLCQVRV